MKLVIFFGSCVLAAWLVLLGIFGHYLVREYVTTRKISSHRSCVSLLLFCFIAFWLFFIFVPKEFIFSEFIFLSLLATISVSDMCTLFIPTVLTIGFIPMGFICALIGYLPISLVQSMSGAAFGYGVLWVFSQLYLKKVGRQGIGEGDFDMLALIGAFTGFYGVWTALTIGSAAGSLLGIFHYFNNKSPLNAPFPFAPLLAFGSYCYLMYSFAIGL